MTTIINHNHSSFSVSPKSPKPPALYSILQNRRRCIKLVNKNSGQSTANNVNWFKPRISETVIRYQYSNDLPMRFFEGKDETVGSKALDVMLYFWEDKDFPDFSNG